jgi:hypothetical protein
MKKTPRSVTWRGVFMSERLDGLRIQSWLSAQTVLALLSAKR